MQNERKSEKAHIPHAPTLLENAVYNEWQFQQDWPTDWLTDGRTGQKHYTLRNSLRGVLIKIFLSSNQSLMHVHARADVKFGNAII